MPNRRSISLLSTLPTDKKRECPLCAGGECQSFFERYDRQLGDRKYYRCPDCRLVFLDPDLRLPAEKEKGRYDLHRNDPADPGYRRFLRQLTDPLSARIRDGDSGLDYGCGPGPAVKKLLEEARAVKVEEYDPFYFPRPDLLKKQYRFVVSTEVAEHFYFPLQEFERLAGLVAPGGILAVMTSVLRREEEFEGWWYHREPTHVCFYQEATFEWIAARFGWRLEKAAENVVFFHSETGNN